MAEIFAEELYKRLLRGEFNTNLCRNIRASSATSRSCSRTLSPSGRSNMRCGLWHFRTAQLCAYRDLPWRFRSDRKLLHFASCQFPVTPAHCYAKMK